MGDKDFGLCTETVNRIANEIKAVHDLGIHICLVIGAGNIFRGVSAAASTIERTSADYMGMLATVMNALAMQSALEAKGVSTRVQSAIPMDTVCEPFIRRRAVRHLEKNRIVIFAAGTGNPFFTTDTCAALRASELDAELLIKATKVQGVYSDDPEKNPEAKFFEQLSYDEVLEKKLRIMDHSAITLCRDNNIPIIVLNIFEKGNIIKAICDQSVGTKILMRE